MLAVWVKLKGFLGLNALKLNFFNQISDELRAWLHAGFWRKRKLFFNSFGMFFFFKSCESVWEYEKDSFSWIRFNWFVFNGRKLAGFDFKTWGFGNSIMGNFIRLIRFGIGGFSLVKVNLWLVIFKDHGLGLSTNQLLWEKMDSRLIYRLR